MITNGNFEAGDTAFSSGLSSLGSCPNSSSLVPGTYAVDTSTANCDSSANSFTDHTGGGNMLIANRDPTLTNVDAWAQTIGPFEPSHTYVFSAYIRPLIQNSGVIVEFYLDGSPMGNPLTLSSTGSAWELLTVTHVANFPGHRVLSIRGGGALAIDGITVLDPRFAGDPSVSIPFALDDITVTDLGIVEIPEPTGAVLLAGGLSLAALRRRTPRENQRTRHLASRYWRSSEPG